LIGCSITLQLDARTSDGGGQGTLRATDSAVSSELLLTIMIAIGLMAIILIALDRNDRRH